MHEFSEKKPVTTALVTAIAGVLLSLSLRDNCRRSCHFYSLKIMTQNRNFSEKNAVPDTFVEIKFGHVFTPARDYVALLSPE